MICSDTLAAFRANLAIVVGRPTSDFADREQQTDYAYRHCDYFHEVIDTGFFAGILIMNMFIKRGAK